MTARLLLGLSPAAMLAACKSTPPVCTPGTDVEFRVLRMDLDRGCFEGDQATGTCDAMAIWLEHHEVDPPEAPCSLDSFSFTELATGDCLRVYPRCPGMLDDARFGDCALSDVESCCAWGEDGDVGYPSCP